MFLSTDNLSEGGTNDSRPENKKRKFYEGENPKSNTTPTGWQTTNEKSHVNSNWQKLRK